MDETLRLWGKNIESRRRFFAPDGSPRASADSPTMTQADLGARLSPPVAQSTVARWESGQMEPRRQYKTQLALILMTDVSMLFPLTRAAS